LGGWRGIDCGVGIVPAFILVWGKNHDI
jgi:hypothetical protein